MEHKILDTSSQKEITDLFTSTFTASEGEEEGLLIGKLASQLSSKIDNREIIGLGIYDKTVLIGSIFFTRLQFDEPILVYMLAPVAVNTEHHGKGVGQTLIKYGLNELKRRLVEIVVTYGDPAFYSKVGFHSLSEEIIQAPLKLSMPEGWLGRSLTNKPIEAIKGRPKCVEAFNDPAYW